MWITMTVSREKVNNEATETATITTTRMPWLPSEKKTSSKKHFFASEWKQSISKKKTYKDFVSKLVHSIGTQQGWRSGESTRYPPELDSQTRRHMWVEFLGSLLCSDRVFSGYSGFPSAKKNNLWFDKSWYRIADYVTVDSRVAAAI